jgi:hypothetical protein
MLYAVLYSPSQRAVHVETLDEYVAKERREVLHDRSTGGYRLMHVASSQEEARRLGSAWQQWRDEREKRAESDSEAPVVSIDRVRIERNSRRPRLHRELQIARLSRPAPGDRR